MNFFFLYSATSGFSKRLQIDNWRQTWDFTYLRSRFTFHRFLKNWDSHSWPKILYSQQSRKLKKVLAKKLVKSNKSIIFLKWICIFSSFKLFPSSKIDFWPFLKLQNMEFGIKNFSWNLIISFHSRPEKLKKFRI